MQKNILFLVFLVILISCKSEKKNQIPDNTINPSVVENPATASSGKSNKNAPVFKFEKEIHDFGEIEDGEKVSFAFKFRNEGNADLVIRAAQGSCGCTVPDYPKEAVKPGNDGLINVTFDSNGREGIQNKTVTIISNTIPNTHTLTIIANVRKAAK